MESAEGKQPKRIRLADSNPDVLQIEIASRRQNERRKLALENREENPGLSSPSVTGLEESEKEEGEISADEEEGVKLRGLEKTHSADERGDDLQTREAVTTGDADADGGEEGGLQERPEETIDVVSDPFQNVTASRSEERVGEELAEVKARKGQVSSPERQTEVVRKLLDEIRNEPSETSQELLEQAMNLLAELPGRIPNHEEFVADSFQSHFPAWVELLKNSTRKSSKSVLSWLKYGFRPRMEGTANAKQDKLRIVQAMLSKVVGPGRVSQYLTGQRPHRIAFPNHKSFYDHFDFVVGETRKNLESGAVAVWPDGAEPPEIIHPMGVVDSAGKRRLICNDRYLNIFLKHIPFQYERPRDVLSFTLPGSFMTTADLL